MNIKFNYDIWLEKLFVRCILKMLLLSLLMWNLILGLDGVWALLLRDFTFGVLGVLNGFMAFENFL